MHEMALMAGVFDIINKYTADIPDKKITRITIVVGELTNAVPAALEAAFEVYAKGTTAQAADLVIKTVPLTARCSECSWQGEIEKHVFICPECSSFGLEILSGRELYVESLEVD